jgi:hypothetical protein
MFQITVVDHVRLSFASILAAYEGHADAAAKLARWTSYAKRGLIALAGITAAVAAIGVKGGYGWQVATAILAAVLFGGCATFVALDHQPRMYGHRRSTARLWVICEKYRALLAEMHDDLVDLPTLRDRRNALVSEAAAVLEHSAPDDRYTYEIAKAALSGPKGAGYPDWLIDRYLPEALRKAPAAPVAPVAP